MRTYVSRPESPAYPHVGDVFVVDSRGGQKPLAPRTDLRNHSPTGFAWGYGGSGPAQLALAILADATGDDELALRHYQAFKVERISRLQREAWEITDQEVREWLEVREVAGASS